MKISHRALACSLFFTALAAHSQTAFTYQGRLIDNGVRANGRYDLSFALYDAATDGDLVGTPITNTAVAVSNGLFTTSLDFGAGAFTNGFRWLEISESTNGSGNFILLTPRQALTAAPYAVVAGTLSGSVSASQLSGTIADGQLSTNVALLNGSANFAGTVSAAGGFIGDGSGVTNIALSGLDSHGGLAMLTNWQPFTLAASLPVGNGPVFVATADVKDPGGIGTPDLITANSYDGNVTVQTNNGDGTFTFSGTYAVGIGPSSVTAVDINNDGWVDLVTANAGDDTVTVLTNNGDGTFALSSTNTVGSEPHSVTVADLNHDGIPDLIVANYYFLDSSLTVLLGVGDGTFTNAPGSPYDVGVEPLNTVAVDVNHDGWVDLVSVNEYDGTVTILTNNADGTGMLMESERVLVGQEPFWVATADVNGDGAPDLITANGFDNTLTVVTNDGSGGFVVASTVPVAGAINDNEPVFVLATNLFGGTLPDLVAVNGADANITVLTNNGDGTFGFDATVGVGNWPVMVAAADVNGDGRLDLVIPNSADNTLSILTNSPGKFSYSVQLAGNGAHLTGLNASALTGGTIADALLSYNVVLANAGNNFSGANIFDNPDNLFGGAFHGDGGGLTNVSVSSLVHDTNDINVTGWGSDGYGQLIAIPAGLSDVTAVAAGVFHGLALRSDSTVVAWGNDYFDYGMTIVPADLTDVIAISAGATHSLALQSDGIVVAWGDNDDGETNVPVDLTDATAISGGNGFSLALKSDGTVVGWGYDNDGEVDVPADLTNVVAISAGDSHSLALKSDGTVAAWGSDYSGETEVPTDLTNVVAVAAGGFAFSVALKSDGTVVAWGDDSYGQTDVPAGLSGVTAVVAGATHVLALKSDGTVVAWGDDQYGQTDVPVGLAHVIALAPGSDTYQGLVIRVGDTSPVAWLNGDNTFNGNVSVNGAINGTGSNSLTGVTVATNAGNQFGGTFTGEGSGLTNVSVAASNVIGAFSWKTITCTNQQAQPNTGYILLNDGLTTLTLPSSANTGDVVRVAGVGAGGWQIAQLDGQSVNAANLTGGIAQSSWTLQAAGPAGTLTAVASSADGTKLVAVAYGDQVYTSTDSGTNWTPQFGSGQGWISVASSADGTKLVALAFGDRIYTSVDSGTNWTTNFGTGESWQSVASSADGMNLVAVAGNYGIYTSADAGTNWTAQIDYAESLGNNWDWYAVASSADGTKLVAATYGGQIYTSTDSGVTWTPQFGSGQNWIALASSADGTKLVAVAANDGIYVSTDSGINWTESFSSNQGWYSVASSADGSTLAAVVNGGKIYTSLDSGTTWTAQSGTDGQGWRSIASSSNGTKMVAAAYQIYTTIAGSSSTAKTTTAGTAGYLQGGRNTSIELLYIGGGVFVPISHEGTINAN